MITTTNSSRASFQRCQRRYYYEYVKCMRPKKSSAQLVFGDAAHKGLEARLKTNIDIDEMLLTVDFLLSDPFSQRCLENLLLGYHFRWRDQDRAIGVLAVEEKFEYRPKGIAEVVCTGKIDGIIKEGSSVKLIEHKTKSQTIEAGSTYWEKLTLDAQISEYMIGARELGHDTETCIYDVLLRPAQKRLMATPMASRKYKRTGELYKNQRERDETIDEYGLRLRQDITANPNKYYKRATVVRFPGELRAYEANRDLIIRQMLDCYDSAEWAMSTGGCDKYNTMCTYFGVCCGNKQLTDGKFEKTEQHPELA